MIKLAHEIEITPAFHDLDPMEIVWHGHYLKYMELARCELLKKFDYDYPQMRESGYAWPIVDLHIKYIRPTRYNQKLVIYAEIVEWENRLKINYTMRDGVTAIKLNKAHTIQVAVEITSLEMQFVCPPILWKKLGIQS